MIILNSDDENREVKFWGQHSTMVRILASEPSCPGFDSQHYAKILSDEIIIDIAEVNQRGWLEERGQWLESVDRTHLVLASGKPVLQKRIIIL